MPDTAKTKTNKGRQSLREPHTRGRARRSRSQGQLPSSSYNSLQLPWRTYTSAGGRVWMSGPRKQQGAPGQKVPHRPRFFYFFIFYFRFLQKYFFVFEIYSNIGRPARCGAVGAFLQKFWRTGRPAAGRPAPPPLYKGWLVPHSSFVSLKFQKPRNEREGGREAKPCRIFEPATAGNQNFSMLYK